MTITAIDALMGKGKTTFIIEYMNKTHEDWLISQFSAEPLEKTCFLVVVPFLTEVERVQTACPALDFVDPCPELGAGKKITHLEKLIENSDNICTTHALFKKLNRAIYSLLKERQYVLVLDETLESVAIYDSIKQHDRRILFDGQYVILDSSNGRLNWNHAQYPNYHGRFSDVMNLCDNGNLVDFRDRVWIWNFPVEFLQCFQDAFILTYLFSSSTMAAYLRSAGVAYSIRTVSNGRMVECTTIGEEFADRTRLKKLISIYEGDMNRVGKPKGNEQPLSSSWLERAAAQKRKAQPNGLDRLKASTETFFKRCARTKAKASAWTTFKAARKYLKGAGYACEFIPFNTKATNDYRHKEAVAYLCNVFMHPYLKGYLESHDARVDEDAYALSELLQWLWRTQIRDGKPIKVFIPSERMRRLLKNWLNGGDLAVPAMKLAA